MPKDLSGAQVGMTPANNINSPRPHNMRGRNEFPQTHKHLTTDRYGDYSPFFWAKCERGDVQNLHSVHDLHTYTLASPMVSDVTMTKSFIKVPMQAIYPRTWEKQFTIPTQGDDVPSDARALLDLSSLLFFFSGLLLGVTELSVSQRIRAYFLLESISSHGSLFERFNLHFNHRFAWNVTIESSDTVSGSFDKWFDSVFAPYLIEFAQSHSFTIGEGQNAGSFTVSSDGSSSSSSTISARRFIELLRSGSVLIDDVLWSDFSVPGIINFDSDGSGFLGINPIDPNPDTASDYFINIEPIISYQLACSQFGTNDFVDFIYSAQLYRDNMESILSQIVTPRFFQYNGVYYLYDVFSQHNLNTVIGALSIPDTFDAACNFLLNLFSYRQSLRYGDYFTGAKPQPLAVGEYTAEVNNNEVSAIDITRSIQMQRLLHRVNMVGRKLGDYLSGIFGGKLPEAPKDVPIFLAHQRFDVKGFEVQNTGDIQFSDAYQNTVTSQLRTSENRYAFEIEIDEPCYIIGMNSYETMRVYSKTLDRFAFHHDRYDDFIPEMQYIGDQDIKQVELDSSSNFLSPYGYALRYMEYKQRYSYASGGFIENLPSWAFITDNADGNPSDAFINPDYIRSSPSEFDRFYKSLSGYSLGSYFHFIVAHTNVTAPLRMMEYTPEILK